ncbi:MlaC/ttg2D family ABC transporter substrate-binding protein [Amphiplicatus metriothermophilus]|uniref:ABC-type transporter Mla maintaining outer membrane lipid asymmetry, MlaC component n=1 Tax=Amphiplicatus metriothermophilus TaxID=1519374 RepID=A0A239PUY4_9PROT|nr:ABC transporter substrate-binding protein [Amphiplicatus metriothermophilus]MBB5519508.1 phospholipid transport system substrate-binding protein [Amphiplicatus metriothermophilus]SNT74075.1 ABC-type transporter Mla maintaining outer membrane lipid asymmetry, MlaC component [Amphiplicatus metriothermophilus]
MTRFRPALFAGLAAAALLAGPPSGPALAAAQDAPEAAPDGDGDGAAMVAAAIAFAQELTDKATAALTDESASEAERLDRFQLVLAEGLALDVIGRFMLGETRKAMTPEQIARYEAVFPDYITRLYAEQFSDIVGRKLEVLEARQLGARDVIVRTQFPRSNGAPIMVDWRVRELRDGRRKMIDIIVSGVSIMLVKREEFSAFVAQNGVDALIERLEAEAWGE